MKKIIYLMITVALFYSCTVEEDDVSLPAAPTASFTAVPSPDSPNVIILTNTSQNGGLAVFDYPGSTGIATAAPVEASFPFAGDYTISMTAIGAGGTAVAETTITISTDDPDALSPVETLLTGGSAGRVWVWSSDAGAFAVGPSASGTKAPTDPQDQSWFSAEANYFDGPGCIYNDSYEFNIDGAFVNNSGGDTFWNWSWANGELGASQGEFSDACFPSGEPENARWSVEMREFEGEEYPFLILSEGSSLGYYEGTSIFQIFSISETEMILRHGNGDYPNAESGGGWRYGKYVTQ